MTRLSLTLLLLFFCNNIIQAQENYNANNIAQELKKNADAVIRSCETIIEINSLTDISISEKKAITILNERGLKYAKLQQYYDKLVKPGKIKAVLYNASGAEIKKMKNSEILDYAVYGFSFFDDNRCREYDFHYSNYPYTISYETEAKYSSLFLLDRWKPQGEDNIAVEKATIEIYTPKNIPLQLKTFNTAQHPVLTEGDNTTIIRFSLKNIEAKEEDELEHFELFPFPTFLFSADTIKMGGIPGSMKTWSAFGRFYHALNANRDILPNKMKAIVHQISDTCTSNMSKISVLYEYLKNNTRYVSIQLGIGGWQTFEAAFVAEKGYGDCKALTNYMKAMLREAGINSYEALVLAGSDKHVSLPKDFIFDCFNHVILCIPEKTDTTWIECTAKTLPAGYLSTFTDDRDVLVCSADGGYITHTPVYKSEQNYINRRTTLSITQNGEIEGNIFSVYSGSKCDEEYRYHHLEPVEKIEKHLNSKFNFTSYQVKKFTAFLSQSGLIPQLSVNTNIAGSGNVQRSGNRIFINPVICPIAEEYIPVRLTRTKPFIINSSYKTADTTICTVTGGSYTLEYLPEDMKEVYAFGEFTGVFTFENENTVKYTRSFKLKEGAYAPELFDDYKKLLKNATTKDQQRQVVLLKKD